MPALQYPNFITAAIHCNFNFHITIAILNFYPMTENYCEEFSEICFKAFNYFEFSKYSHSKNSDCNYWKELAPATVPFPLLFYSLTNGWPGRFGWSILRLGEKESEGKKEKGNVEFHL